MSMCHRDYVCTRSPMAKQQGLEWGKCVCICIMCVPVLPFPAVKINSSHMSLQNGLSVWFTGLHNHGEDCWSDSCPENNNRKYQPREPQHYEDCQAKSIQEFGWTSQGMGWGQGIKGHHTQTCQELWLQLLSEVTYLGLGEEELYCCPVVQSPFFRWEQVLYFIWKPRSGGRVEKLIAQVAWSPVLSFYSLWWFGVQCHLLVLVHILFFF